MQGRKHESWRQYRPACIQRYYTCLKRATREPLRCPLLDSPGGSSSQILIEFVYVGCLWACRHTAAVGHFYLRQIYLWKTRYTQYLSEG